MRVLKKAKFYINRLRERLWVKPFFACVLSLSAVIIAKVGDLAGYTWRIPYITDTAIEALLTIMGSSMLVIATFAVTSMVSAYASASDSATPRSFKLIVADDMSQNALSTFVGAFIFSIVALTAAKSSFFLDTGMSLLFIFTVIVFAMVVLTFVRWVDQIARLGRLDASIEKAERATTKAIEEWRKAPTQCAKAADNDNPEGTQIFASDIGYVQHIDVPALQEAASDGTFQVTICALPGTFVLPGRVIAIIESSDEVNDSCAECVQKAFVIGNDRVFDEDPRFGFIVLSEIADRALSPGVNDPGTAIGVMGSMARLFALWCKPMEDTAEIIYDRVFMPQYSVRDMVDDAFTAISRDGAGVLEVMLRVQKILESLTHLQHDEMTKAAKAQSRLSLARAEAKLDLPEEVALVRRAAAFSES